jgi:hypothetical protein
VHLGTELLELAGGFGDAVVLASSSSSRAHQVRYQAPREAD